MKTYESFISGLFNRIDVSDVSVWFDAAKNGNDKIIKEYLKHVDDEFVNIQNRQGQTALMLSAMHDKISTAMILIEAGADVNIADKDDDVPSIWSAYLADHKQLKMMIDNNADVNSINDAGYTALIIASVKKREDNIKILLENRADISLCKIKNALMYSTETWNKVDVQELIITRQPWNIKFFDDRIGFLPELKVKYKDEFDMSDLNI